MNYLQLLLLLCSLYETAYGYSGVIDLITGQKIKKQWLSFGLANLNTAYWVSLQSESSFQAFGPTSTIVLMSLPDLGGPLATDGVPTATRIRNVTYDAGTGRVSFQAKVRQELQLMYTYI